MRYTLLLLMAVGLAAGGCASFADSGASWGTPPPPAPTECPDCGDTLIDLATAQDDTDRPSRNLSIWNRSICGGLAHGPGSVICTNCWLAYRTYFGSWDRASELPDSFNRPLTAAIRNCPLPAPEDRKNRIVYSQEIKLEAVNESVFFWCTPTGDFIPRLRQYAEEHDLSLRVELQERIPEEWFVIVETKPAV